MNKFSPKQFNFSNVKYMTPSQLGQHYTLYTKYIDSLDKVNDNMDSKDMFITCNQNYSPIRSAEKATTFCIDSIKLHELYFGNLTGNNTTPFGKIENIIIDNFGSYKNFTDKFKCIGMSMRGWVTFCHDLYTDDYYIYGQDSHDDGVILCAKPLIVLDVYEHAYMIDYGINRGLYIDSFFKNLDFKVVNERIS